MIPFEFLSSMVFSTEYTKNGNGRFSDVNSSMMEKSALAGQGGGARPPPSFYFPSRTKMQCTLQLRGQIHSMYFISTLCIQYRYVLCSLMFLSDFFMCIYPSETGNKSILLSLPTKFKFRCFFLLVISFFWSVHCNFVYT
jgi:hypothetical protein